MAQTIWSGSISFGLVSVDIKLISATKSKDVSFNQIDSKSGARVRQRRVSEKTGDEVPLTDIVKGFEVAEGEYVIIEPSELDAIAPKSTQQIEIEAFVDLDEIDPIYFESPYYVVPDKKSAKAYALLINAMEEMRKVAIGRIVMRSKEHLVAIRPLDGVLCVETMRFADEVVGREGLVHPPEGELSDKELKMAGQLIDALTAKFEPEEFSDTYREKVLSLIDDKKAGRSVVAIRPPDSEKKVVDLMAALEESLRKAKPA